MVQAGSEAPPPAMNRQLSPTPQAGYSCAMSTKLHSILILGLIGLPLAGSAAESPGPRLSLASVAQGSAFEATVTGVAADGCERRLVEAELREREVRLHARQATGGCLAEPQPYALAARVESPLPAGVYRVRLENSLSAAALPRLQAFELAEVGPATAPLRPEAGFWWGDAHGEFDTARQGFGVQLEVQGDTLAVAVSGYDAAGEPQWLIGAGTFGGRTSRIALGRLRNGGGPFGEARSPSNIEPAGQLHIEWQGSARAVFWFEQPALDGAGIELRPMSMVRFAFAGERQWLGRWLLAGESAADSAIAARAIDFESVETQDGAFVAVGTGGERLACVEQPAAGGVLPPHCTLTIGDDGRIDFDDVGVARLHGSDAVHGQRAVLLRLDR
jgi:hypothetical protein